MRSIQDWCEKIHDTAVRKGWWKDPNRSIAEQVSNFHSEITEAWEEIRDNHAPDHLYYGPNGKPEGFGIELADCVIRIMDTCANYGIDLERMIELKTAFNDTRSHRHGGKAA